MTDVPSVPTVVEATTPGLSWRAVRGFYPGHRAGSFLLTVPAHDLIYVKNPKSACSTLVAWLHLLHTGRDAPRLVHREHGLPTVEELGRRRVLQMLAGGAYRFSFVRDPLRRLESAYWDKLVRSQPWRARAFRILALPGDVDRRVSFEEFLEAIERQDPVAEMDPHWRPQHVNLLHPLVTFDHVGKVETLGVDVERIRREAGLPLAPIESRNVRRRTQESVFTGRPDLVNRVERLYAMDFELYGY